MEGQGLFVVVEAVQQVEVPLYDIPYILLRRLNHKRGQVFEKHQQVVVVIERRTKPTRRQVKTIRHPIGIVRQLGVDYDDVSFMATGLAAKYLDVFHVELFVF